MDPLAAPWKMLVAMFIAATLFAACGEKHGSASSREGWIDRNGKTWLFATGFSTKRWKLVVKDNKWHLLGDGVSTGKEDGGDLAVPFTSRFNDIYDLRFDTGGQVYLVKKASGDAEEIKRIEGKWCYDASDHWQDFDSVWDDLMEPRKENESPAEKLAYKFLLERRPYWWETLDSNP